MRFTIFFLLLFLSPGWAQEVRQKICLAMSVCDDEAVIETSLQSVKEIVDYVVVCDRGSTDQTKPFITRFLQESHIPGEILSEPFSLPRVRQQVQSLGWDLSNTYLLVLRPDAIGVIDKGFSKADLTRDGYLVLEPKEEVSVFVHQPNFLRASAPWGVAQPYVGQVMQTFHWRVNEHQEYQSSRVERKIEELLRDLAHYSNDPDRLVLLAGLYKKKGNYEKAIHFYQKCALLDGRSDQIWLARVMLAECLEKEGDEKNALYWTLEAYRIQPDRTELLAKIFRPSHR